MSGEGDGCGNAVLGFGMRDDTTIGRHRGVRTGRRTLHGVAY